MNASEDRRFRYVLANSRVLRKALSGQPLITAAGRSTFAGYLRSVDKEFIDGLRFPSTKLESGR